MTIRTADFGDDFTWGVASAAWQVEGAWNTDGKRPSVWDEATLRGRVRGGLVALEGSDAFYRLDEDLDLLQAMCVSANRFSVSWPRVYGDGRGPWNDKGGEYYDRLVDGCLARGIEPWLTVHHWDLPQALWLEGGWTRRGIVEDFAAFAEQLALRFGDRVSNWMVFNEPLSVMGHIAGGIFEDRLGPRPLKALQSMHHMNLACAEAGRRMRAALPADHKIGTTNVFTLCAPFDASGRLKKAQRTIEALTVDAFLDPAGGLGYPFDESVFLRPLKRYVRDGDLEACAFDYDFMGVQYYGPTPMRSVPLVGGLPVPSLRGAEANVKSTTSIPVEPKGLTEILRRYQHHPACKRFVITESGFGGFDRKDRDGRVRDDLRVWYARTHLEALRDAMDEGIPVDGFFQWSYADNIEWIYGREGRYGVIYVDYEDGFRRIPKDSYRWFQQLLTTGEVD
ncbi:MAG: glycoside hydrolase family 1 protein [Actinomycetes bacterium]